MPSLMGLQGSSRRDEISRSETMGNTKKVMGMNGKIRCPKCNSHDVDATVLEWNGIGCGYWTLVAIGFALGVVPGIILLIIGLIGGSKVKSYRCCGKKAPLATT